MRESINFKLPPPLAAALRAEARKRNTTATDLVIKGLQQVLGDVPGVETSVESRLHELETQLNEIALRIESRVENNIETGSQQRLSHLEQKQEALALKLAQVEGAIAQLSTGVAQMSTAIATLGRGRSKSSSYPSQYYPQKPQFQPFNEESLAMRFSTNVETIRARRANAKEFELWCKDRDPSKVVWRFNEKDGLFHPVDD